MAILRHTQKCIVVFVTIFALHPEGKEKKSYWNPDILSYRIEKQAGVMTVLKWVCFCQPVMCFKEPLADLCSSCPKTAVLYYFNILSLTI